MNNILVTGGCGFIGANFIHYLLSDTVFGGRIVNMDKLTYAGNPENLSGLDESSAGRFLWQPKESLAQPLQEADVRGFSDRRQWRPE